MPLIRFLICDFRGGGEKTEASATAVTPKSAEVFAKIATSSPQILWKTGHKIKHPQAMPE